MIKKYDRDVGQGYYNIVQIISYFLYGELMEYFIYFGIYNAQAEVYNYRRMFWISSVLLFCIALVILVALTCLTYLSNNF